MITKNLNYFKKEKKWMYKEKETSLDTETDSSISLDIYEAEKLIQAFKKLPLNKEQRKSFIEIMGVSHLESVSSKTLAFFMDTKEQHKLNDLVLSSLFEVIGEDFPYQIHTEKVLIEKSTELGRIDLWVETSDHIIVIENKINHHANNNPFDDYISHAEINNPDNKKLIFILLVIYEPKLSIPNYFKVVKHFDLYKHVLKGLGQHTFQADQYYLSYLVDYIAAIEKFNPNSEYSKMQMDIVNFYRNNREILEKIQDEDTKSSVYQYYEQKNREIIASFKDQGIDIFEDGAEFNRNEVNLDSIGGSLNSKTLTSSKENYKVEFEVYTSTSYTNLWCRRYKGKNMTKQDSIELQALLKSENINFVEQDAHNDVLLLEDTESISVKDFVEKAVPIIKQLLSVCKVEGFKV